jgi:hypothetical protein
VFCFPGPVSAAREGGGTRKQMRCADCPFWMKMIREGWKYCEFAVFPALCVRHGKSELEPYSTLDELRSSISEENYLIWKHLCHKNSNCMPGGVNYDYSYLIFQERFENELLLKNFGIISEEPNQRCRNGKEN